MVYLVNCDYKLWFKNYASVSCLEVTMARPSMASERTQQIIDATIRTIAKHGYAETTLDRIAQESGLARGHVRHYVGNRQNLIREAIKSYYFHDYDSGAFWPGAITTVQQAVDYLFSNDFVGTREENKLIFGFIEAARTDQEISDIMLSVYMGAEKDLARLLKKEHPEISSSHLNKIAFGVVSIAIHNVFLLDISAQAKTTSLAKSSAQLIISSLTTTKENS